MQTNIYLSEESENNIDRLKPLARKNKLGTSKKDIIEFALMLADYTKYLDDEDFKQLTGLKK